MDLRVPVDLAGGGEQEAGVAPSGQFQCCLGALSAGPQRLDRMSEVVRRRRQAGEVSHRIDAPPHMEPLADVGFYETEALARRRVRQVRTPSRGEVVDPDHLVTVGEEGVAQVRAEKAGGARDDDPAHRTPKPSYCSPALRTTSASSRLRVSSTEGVRISAAAFTKSISRNSDQPVITVNRSAPRQAE